MILTLLSPRSAFMELASAERIGAPYVVGNPWSDPAAPEIECFFGLPPFSPLSPVSLSVMLSLKLKWEH